MRESSSTHLLTHPPPQFLDINGHEGIVQDVIGFVLQGLGGTRGTEGGRVLRMGVKGSDSSNCSTVPHPQDPLRDFFRPRTLSKRGRSLAS